VLEKKKEEHDKDEFGLQRSGDLSPTPHITMQKVNL